MTFARSELALRHFSSEGLLSWRSRSGEVRSPTEKVSEAIISKGLRA